MRKLIHGFLIFLLILAFFPGCKPKNNSQYLSVRRMVDTIGFAKYSWQMDSILLRMNNSTPADFTWRVAITPHDDYAYVGDLYPRILKGVRAKTIILFGVAHKARDFDLEDQLVFDSFDVWNAPYGRVPVSGLRNDLTRQLSDSLFVVHDKMHQAEHSLEAVIPFLQSGQPDLEIVPVLVPYMSFDKMMQIANPFAVALKQVMSENELSWGKDLALVISTDAVHYGDKDWGGKNYAPFGTDSIGLQKAKDYELEIIHNCLMGKITPQKIQSFINYTVQEDNYKEYKWTWCGRYAVPLGLLTAYTLDSLMGGEELQGVFVGYSSSVDHAPLKVHDLNMGTTAPAYNHHWVGYAAVGYE
ncbi:MAG: AmmeMemoRadiSam system protein B [Bacteroidales bacterium]|jgi:AmmeMemoRadiSam system protein B|nr:AmmeMemoRadiSam system protein B [Bacteroidales bacterium]